MSPACEWLQKSAFAIIAEIVKKMHPNTVKRVKSLAKNTLKGLPHTWRSSVDLAKHVI